MRQTVSALAFDRSGKRVASATEDATISLWGTTSGEQLLTLFGHMGAVTSLAFRLAANVAYDAIDSDGIAPFIETLDHDIALVGFHRERSPRAQFCAALVKSTQKSYQSWEIN